MKRAIKFRAFDKEAKTMHKVSQIDFDYQFALLETSDGDYFQKHFRQIELMQFTGLYDKHEKEIYEGDVIPIFGENHAVKFKTGMFTINDRGMTRYIHSIPLKVIGNVYENPELVK